MVGLRKGNHQSFIAKNPAGMSGVRGAAMLAPPMR